MAPKIIKTDMPFPVFSMEADRDYLLARMIHYLGGGFHARAGFFAQQACEKYLKALSVQADGSYAETHKLAELLEVCVPHHEFLGFETVKNEVKKFDMFDQVGRYGGAAKHDPLSKGETIADSQFYPSPGLKIAGAWIWTPGHLASLDRFVYNVRGRLDFKAAKFDDALLSIMIDNQRSALVSTWKGPLPIKDVLTRDNAYFNETALRTASPDKS